MTDERPRLRPYLEPLPVELPDLPGPAYLLRDPFKLNPSGQVVLPLPSLLLAGLMDGSRTLPRIQAEFEARHGVRVELEQLEQLVAGLEGACLLDGPALARAVAEFAAAEERPPACIGSYPGEPEELREFLAEQFLREGGPGGPPGPGGGAPIRALISPHIDFHRGGHAYAWTWRAAVEDCPAELFVVFGTSHTGTAPLLGSGGGREPRFALTRKRFATPLGTVPTDVERVERLLAAYRGPDDLLAGEFHHKGEHSIEFQAVCLRGLLGDRPGLRILPVLCGGIADLEGDPRQDPGLAAFHEALRAALADIPRERVAFVAAIDLAHLGAQFHEPPLAEAALPRLEQEDRATLELALGARDPAAVHRDILRDGGARNICGHAALVATLQAIQGEELRGELLRYDRWYDGESAVSFAGAVWRG